MKLPTWQLPSVDCEDVLWAAGQPDDVCDMVLRTHTASGAVHVLDERGGVAGVWPPCPADLPDVHVEGTVFGRRLFSGRSVHLFHNGAQHRWVLGTKKTLGAPVIVGRRGNRDLTVKTLFLETTKAMGVEPGSLDTSITYSFLFSHNEDGRYEHTNRPRLALLSTQHVISVEGVKYGAAGDWEAEAAKRNLPVLVEEEIDDLRLLTRSLARGTLSADCPGVLLARAGKCYCLPNATHDPVKKLAGCQPSDLYAYLAHKKMKTVRTALAAAPERVRRWGAYNALVRSYTGMLFQRYQEIFVLKTQTFESLGINGQVGNQLWRLHQLRTCLRRPMKCGDVIEMLGQRPRHSVYSGMIQYLAEARD